VLTSINIINPPPPLPDVDVGRVMRDMTMDYPFVGLQRVNIAIAPQSFTLLRFVMLQLIKIAPAE